MSLAASLFVFAVVAAGSPHAAPAGRLDVAEADHTPVRCRPAPYYVADQGGDRLKPERLLVTGSRVPMVIRDVDARRPKPPCLLMRDDGAANPLRPAD